LPSTSPTCATKVFSFGTVIAAAAAVVSSPSSMSFAIATDRSVIVPKPLALIGSACCQAARPPSPI
jgi:hypothetical protein